MAFVSKALVLVACTLVAKGGVIQQQLPSAGAVAASYRFDRPLQGQLTAAPVAPTTLNVAPVGLSRVLAPAAPAAPLAANEYYDANPQYTFSYEVQDGLTGDNKNQVETRDGDVVQGSYSLNDPDGTRRTVEYTADPVHGFNAIVHREPQGAATASIPAPPLVKVHAPAAYPNSG